MELNITSILPEIILGLFVIGMMLADIFLPIKNKNSFFMASAVAAIAIAGFTAMSLTGIKPAFGFSRAIRADLFGTTAKILILASTLLTVLSSKKYIEIFKLTYKAEYYYTLLTAAIGGMILVSANELITFFVSLELMSISVYILIAMFKDDYRGKEAAIKYFILGSVGSAFIILGFTVLYAITGTTTIGDMFKFILNQKTSLPIILAIASVGTGLFFKVGIIPFHMWTPDVYEGSPTVISAFMASAIKVAAFMAFVRIFYPVFSPIASMWETPFSILAALTMLAGSLMALNQNNIKRLLAYSSIAHSGVLLSALLTASISGIFSIVFYLFVYAFMNISAFILVSSISDENLNGENIKDFSGLFKQNPFIATAGIIIFMSLAGIPPFAGFFAKFYVITSLIEAKHVLLAITVVLSSLISLYFYLKPVVYSFMKNDTTFILRKPTLEEISVILSSCLIIIIFGILPSPLVKLAMFSVGSFLHL